MVRAFVTDNNGDVYRVVSSSMERLMESIDFNYVSNIKTVNIQLKDFRQGKDIWIG